MSDSKTNQLMQLIDSFKFSSSIEDFKNRAMQLDEPQVPVEQPLVQDQNGQDESAENPEPSPVEKPEPRPIERPEPEPVRNPEPAPVKNPEPEPVKNPEPE